MTILVKLERLPVVLGIFRDGAPSIVGRRSSGPAALFGCKFLRSLSIPATEMVMSGISGNSGTQPGG